MKNWKQIKIIDTHTHTNMSPLEEDFHTIAQQALAKGVGFNIVSCDRKMCDLAIFQARQYDHIVASVGYHPTDLKDLKDEDLDYLEQLIINHNDQIVCVGEVGLDYYHELEYSREYQKEWFIKQIKLALKYNLTLNLHIRYAHDDAIQILQKYQVKKVIIHCFTDAYRFIPIYNQLGYYVSFPGVITFKATPKNNILELYECVRAVDLDRILVETDAPFLTPTPYRGKTNYPYYVIETAKKIAEIRNVSEEEMFAILKKNALRSFV
ncbi:TatD family hydrolase [Ureaplasma sp. ES3154-GEN]|uniref:TatD family hydrolase n=1 Tax=Ureaplasma sp. ES3154-GEN TaxID=2984844 RepID=UPI0021E8E505|nr:TatD family hydrolase [Ureaplasma sp. ES3154-GEN]MCV3743743.1 TatD family hydrolase [Ureaplasma sp. ES3154-GEN]